MPNVLLSSNDATDSFVPNIDAGCALASPNHEVFHTTCDKVVRRWAEL